MMCDGKPYMAPYVPAPLSAEETALRRVALRKQLIEVREDPERRVTCIDCGRRLSLTLAYRCLYCGFWFCPACARIHFGAPEGIIDPKVRYGVNAVTDVESDLEQAKSMSREEYFKFIHGDWDEALRREDAARYPEEGRAVAGEGE